MVNSGDLIMENKEQLAAIARILGNVKTERVMHFGEYKGADLSEIPTSYLSWILDKVVDDALRVDIEAEIMRQKRVL